MKLRSDLVSGEGVMKDVLTSWERRYRAFCVRRFDRYSRGGGDWKKLSPVTIALKKSTAILVDTRTMRLRLPLAIRTSQITKNSVTLTFRDGYVHPKARVSIARLLTKHDLGRATPKRPILVQPDDQTKQEILRLTTKAFANAANGRR